MLDLLLEHLHLGIVKVLVGLVRLQLSIVLSLPAPDADLGSKVASFFLCLVHRTLLPLPRQQKRPSASPLRSEEHTSELQSLMRTSYAVFCLKKKKQAQQQDI